MLKRNLIANFFGQFWGVAIGIAFVPVYIHYLGTEAYGVVGFYAMLQGWLSLLDVGLSPTLVREMSRFRGGAHDAERIRDILRSIEVAGAALALVAASAIFLLAPYVASDWLRPEHLPAEEITRAVQAMAAIAGLRMIESLHRSTLLGLEQQVLANVASSILATIRAIGALVVLAWASPTLHAFFLWQLAVSVLTCVSMAACAYRALPEAPRGGRPSMAAFGTFRAYAGLMSAGAVIGFCLTQVDKVLLSKLLPLDSYGKYVVGSTAASGITLLVGPIAQAYFPRLCQMHASGNRNEMVRAFHMGSQVVTTVVGSAAIVLACNADAVLFVWTGDRALAAEVAPVTTLLAVGNLLNALTWMLYQVQLACGWVRFGLFFNAAAICLVVPAMLMAVPRFGAIGAAWVWVGLNVGFVLLGPLMAFSRLMPGEYSRWMLHDLIIPMVAAAAGTAVWLQQSRPPDYTRISTALILAGVSCTTMLLAALASSALRRAATALVRAKWHRTILR